MCLCGCVCTHEAVKLQQRYLMSWGVKKMNCLFCCSVANSIIIRMLIRRFSMSCGRDIHVHRGPCHCKQYRYVYATPSYCHVATLHMQIYAKPLLNKSPELQAMLSYMYIYTYTVLQTTPQPKSSQTAMWPENDHTYTVYTWITIILNNYSYPCSKFTDPQKGQSKTHTKTLTDSPWTSQPHPTQ